MIHQLTKGNRWRHLVAEWLESRGFAVAKRGIGDAGDDLTAVITGLTLSVEAKNHQRMDISTFVNQAERQAPTGQVPVVFAHRRGRSTVDESYVIMTGRAFGELIR